MSGSATGQFSDLYRIASESLTANIVELSSGWYLRAGGHQFQALWTRDFCFASRGLLALGRADVVRDHLTLLLRSVRKSDGILPKYFDSVPILWRYANLKFGRNVTLSDPLKPGYTAGLPPSLSVDSNALVVIAASDYVRATGDQTWWQAHLPALKALHEYYEGLKKDGLVSQGPFADWQDSVRREGKTFLTNLLVHEAGKRLAVEEDELRSLAGRIRSEFRTEQGLYRSQERQPQVSLEGNLLAFEYGFDVEVYEALKKSPLWSDGFPGFATDPDYPASSVSWVVRAVGVRHYHDRIRWSWLIGLAAKVAKLAGDAAAAEEILSQVQEMAIRDGTICEIYERESPYEPYRASMYQCEWPFSWGAALLVDALSTQPPGR